ncbi:hypothetical protein BH24ACT5_BH24ACT5_03450 [soil metagenome]
MMVVFGSRDDASDEALAEERLAAARAVHGVAGERR